MGFGVFRMTGWDEEWNNRPKQLRDEEVVLLWALNCMCMLAMGSFWLIVIWATIRYIREV